MVATTTARVSQDTNEKINFNIQRAIEMSLAYYAKHTDEIDQRLHELRREWDIERFLETGSSVLTLAGIVGAITRGRYWLLLSLAVQGFFLQHAVTGWCPPLTLLRQLGVRNQKEIEQERCGLTRLRNQGNSENEAEAARNQHAEQEAQ